MRSNAMQALITVLEREDIEPSSQPITADTVRRVACDCAMTRVLLGPNSERIDVGRCTRTIQPALRRVLVVRDKQCRFPGCDRPPDWCEGQPCVARCGLRRDLSVGATPDTGVNLRPGT